MSDPAISAVLSGAERWAVVQEDALAVLRELPDCSVDAVVTDPPAGISFMQKGWDSDKGGRDKWIAWLAEIMTECKRVMKPGAHAFVWALPRTSHWTGMAIEDAGFEVRDCVAHMFGSGFPKSLAVGRAIDEAAGAEREVVGRKTDPQYQYGFTGTASAPMGHLDPRRARDDHAWETAPATEAAKQWDGWGTALKPAYEFWWLARKPLSGTVAQNVCEHGTGGLNVEACRVGTESIQQHGRSDAENRAMAGRNYAEEPGRKWSGRWPPNCVFTHSAGCRRVGEREVRRELRDATANVRPSGFGNMQGSRQIGTTSETVPAYACAPGCPVAELGRQSGESLSSGGSGEASKRPVGHGWGTPRATGGKGDTGTAARFYPQTEWTEPDWWPFHYCAKASRSERERGCEGLPAHTAGEATGGRAEGSAGLDSPRAGAGRTGNEIHNHHPTVKPIELCRWLVRLVTPPGGIVLDPFAGSGSTLIAAGLEGFSAIGIDLDEHYCEIARARAKHCLGGHWQPRRAGAEPSEDAPVREQEELF